MVLSSFPRVMGLGANVGALVFVVGSVDTKSTENAFFTVVKTGGVKFLLQEMFFCTIIVHPSSSSFLSSSGPVHPRLLPESSFSAYPPYSAEN